ncbi:MAG: hypothetical protein QHH14_02235 [Clostridiales bacterium]|jgi:hypothetical protein|nr:hypothetical protein [Clostridiales bacterium]
MKTTGWTLLVCLGLMAAAFSCAKPSPKDVGIMAFALDNLDGLLTQSGVELDRTASTDGRGSVKIFVAEPAIVRLFETGDIDVEDAVLVYQAKLKTEGVEGPVYLEMLCHFEGKGEFFSRGLHSPLKGTVGWTTQEIPFFLKNGENPDNVKLNIVCEGPGTVWVDDVRLVKRPLTE